MANETIWERSPHTGVKHQIERGYLGAWFGKLAWTKRVIFVDGFAGPGRYLGGEEGSPLIALKMANEHPAFADGREHADCERVLVFIEKDPRRFAHLQTELAEIELPPHVKVFAINSDFSVGITNILDSAGGRLAPAFVMIDPFGWTDFPFALVERLGRENRSEVMVSFMIESINRWIDHPQQGDNWDALFGCDEWRQMPRDVSAEERRDFLMGLYARRLREAGFTFQWRFELRDEGNRPEYYLVFGSKSQDGLAAMKETMWKVAPDGSFRYSDYEQGHGQMQLFLGDPDPERLVQTLKAAFTADVETSKGLLLTYTLTETDFVEKHLNAALRWAERNGHATIRRPDGKTRAFFADVWVTFSP